MPRATSRYYCCFAHNTDVAYTRMASSSKDVLIKENEGIKRNVRRNRVHFQRKKKQRKQTQKGSNNALTSHYQSSLFLSLSVLSKFTAPPAALLLFATPSKITLQWKNEDLHVLFVHVEIVQHRRNHAITAEKSLKLKQYKKSEATMKKSHKSLRIKMHLHIQYSFMQAHQFSFPGKNLGI